jgi:hypothetical protein
MEISALVARELLFLRLKYLLNLSAKYLGEFFVLEPACNGMAQWRELTCNAMNRKAFSAAAALTLYQHC